MLSLPYLSAAVFASILFIWQLIKALFPWLPDDIYYIKVMFKCLSNLSHLQKKNIHFCTKIIEHGKKIPHQKFVLYEDKTWTYQEMDRWSNRCARAFKNLGLVSGNKIGIMMMNEPAFIALWIGCNKIGATASFLNYNLRQKSLLHCIDISELKVLVIGKDSVLLEAAKQIDSELKERKIKVFVYGPSSSDYESLASLVDEQPFEECPYSWRKDVNYTDPICYIFTSGTTGLPKAVVVNNRKSWSGGQLVGNMCCGQANDVIYTAMPLYHSAASLIGIVGAVNIGCTVALRKKFSASQFWPDCRKYKVTIAQYVGETLRYVCNQPETPDDRNHQVRAVVGNGLRPDVWRTFLDRFGADILVMEFYAATEGNIGFFNVSNKFGCVGTCSPLLQMVGAASVVKFDHDKEEMVRGPNGRAILCEVNEPGLLIGKISERFAISRYKGKESLTEKKILRNVFKDGDQYFNTGDLVKIDTEYKVFFCDRIGDTFRWKGENVSTNEVGDTIAQAPGVQEVNVYGVEVPKHDGRAGMAAIVPEKDSFDFEALYRHICDALPAYARPLFLRMQEELEITGTNKQKKVNLKKDGYSLENAGNDKIYFIDHKLKTYVPFTQEMQKDVDNATVRL